MDDAAWAALTLSLTLLGGVWTWLSFRRHGAVAALRALGFTMLPLAAYLTKTLQMFTRIVNAVTDWATNVAFSPVVWLGMLLGGVGIVLIVVSGMVRSRQHTKGAPPPVEPRKPAGPILADTDTDPEMAEIEAILRKRGIG